MAICVFFMKGDNFVLVGVLEFCCFKFGTKVIE